MTRDKGFAIADMSTSHLEDPKIKALWRKLKPDEGAMALCLTLYEATVLASWRDGERISAEDAAPSWVSEFPKWAARLAEAGLLDSEHRIPRRTWTTWFATAYKRREKSRARWRRSKQPSAAASVNSTGDSARNTRGVRVDSRVPFLPSVPTESKNGRKRETRERAPTRAGDVLGDLMTPELASAMAFAESKR